ncbi:MAG: COX15/CtaA family protein, partial [Planctomycetota bacterium]
MASGALVAGLDAGRSYTDWPLMAGEIFPSNYIDAELGVRSLFEGREATQFNHRFLAYVLFAACWISVWLARSGELYRDFRLLALFMSVQAVWGVLTLVNAAPMSLALLHQAFGVIVFLAAVRLAVRALR